MSAVRWAVTAFLVFPVVWWVASYLAAHRTLEGIAPAFALGLLDSAAGLLASAVEHPVQTVVYLLFLLALGRFARG